MTHLQTVLLALCAIPAMFIFVTIMRAILLVATVVHEGGHWLVAKAFRLNTPIFSLVAPGKPYRVFRTAYGTQFRVGQKWLPEIPTKRYALDPYRAEHLAGAYVYVLTETPPADHIRRIEEETGFVLPKTVPAIPKWQKALVNAGGILANLVVALLFGLPTFAALTYLTHAPLWAQVVLAPFVTLSALLTFFNFLLGVTQLIPIPDSDGLHLLQLLKRRKDV